MHDFPLSDLHFKEYVRMLSEDEKLRLLRELTAKMSDELLNQVDLLRKPDVQND